MLRGALGSAVFERRADDEIAVNGEVLVCDAARFERLLDAGQDEDALVLYAGDLLAGFFVDGLPAFERWLEEERSRLRRRAGQAARDLVDRAVAAGAGAGARRGGG